MENLLHDVRFAVRSLLRSPGFTWVAVLTLALGIGVNTAMFGAVDAVLLKPLPYAQPERLVRVLNQWEGTAEGRLSAPEFRDYGMKVGAFSSMGVYARAAVNLTGGQEPERLQAAAVSAGLLPTFGVRPVLGRFFTIDEDRPDGPAVAVISEGLWRRRYGGASDIIGRRIDVDGTPTSIVGVLPASFRLPDEFAEANDAQVYVPIALTPMDYESYGGHDLLGVARVRTGIEVSRASSEVAAIAATFVRDHPDSYPPKMHMTGSAQPLQEGVVGPIRGALLVVLGGVGLVLLIACANVASLLLARAEGRRREFAVRSALGASRGDIVRQLLVESTVLGIAGGAFGLMLAAWGSRLLVAFRPADIPRLDQLRVDARVLAVAFGLSLLTAGLFGLAPLMQLEKSNRFSSLRDSGGSSAGAGSRRFRSSLVVGQISLAVVLLVGALLLVRTLVALNAVDPGYDVDNLLTFRISLPTSSYADESKVIGFYPQLLERIRGVSGVRTAGAVSNLPLESDLGDLNFRIEGRDMAPGARSPRADWQVVTPGYLETMRIKLVRGRGIQSSDDVTAPGVIVISEGVAHANWPNEDAIGKRLRLGGGAGPGVVTVIGIVSDVKHSGLGAPPKPTMYLAHQQFRFWNHGSVVRSLSVTIRSAGDAHALAAAAQRELHAIDPMLPVSELHTMQEVVATSLARPRFFTWLLGAFAGLAMALSAVGIYGLMAYNVRRRTREVGVRMALGARPSEIASLIMGEGARLAGIGLVIGLIAAAVLTRLMVNLLYGVKPVDPITLVSVAVGLTLTAGLACFVPALAASRIQPVVAISEE